MKKRNFSVNDPDVVNMDDLAYASDDELIHRMRYLYDGQNDSRDPFHWEIEIAYVQREIDIRRTRHEFAKAFVTSNDECLPQDTFND